MVDGDQIVYPLLVHLLGDRVVAVEVHARDEEVDVLLLHLRHLGGEVRLTEGERRVVEDDLGVDLVSEAGEVGDVAVHAP